MNRSLRHRVGALAAVLLAGTVMLAWASPASAATTGSEGTVASCPTKGPDGVTVSVLCAPAAAADYPLAVDVRPAGAAPALASPTRGTTGTLSRTGSDSARYAAFAVALVVAGSAVVLVTRRRRADSTA